MAKPEKSNAPAYISYSYFLKFHNDLRDTHVPPQIDRSVMSKASGSQQSAMMQSLKFLGFIDANNKPTELMKRYAQASDEQRGAVLKAVLKDAYAFVMSEDFDLATATGHMVAEKFREQGVGGSTASKAIAFFLAAAKDAGVKVSPLVKPPAAPKAERKTGGAKRGKGQESFEEEPEEAEERQDDGPDAERIELPIPHKGSAIIRVPLGLTQGDWEYVKRMLDLYLEQMHKEPA
jgi:hypothetical protein